MNPNRFLNFGAQASGSGSSGSGGGSGNFLFDIIRVSIECFFVLTFSHSLITKIFYVHKKKFKIVLTDNSQS